jgi:hypothetical protein
MLMRGSTDANTCLRGQAQVALPGRRQGTACPLNGAFLSEANLSGTDLRQANLSGANLRGTDLRGARGVDMTGSRGKPAHGPQLDQQRTPATRRRDSTHPLTRSPSDQREERAHVGIVSVRFQAPGHVA